MKLSENLAQHANQATQAGAGITILSAWLSSHSLVITAVGMLFGIVLSAVGIYVQLSKSRLERKELELRIAALQKDTDTCKSNHDFK